jgi:septum formation protein
MHIPESLPHFILASGSPRRKELLLQAGLRFDVISVDVDEMVKPGLEPLAIVDDLALRKQAACVEIRQNKMVITADTLVFLQNEVLAKPANKAEARAMLNRLAAKEHKVTTAVCLGYEDKIHQFNVTTDVHFKALSDDMIDYYIDNYQPYDKAGSYGIQEWLGQVGIDRINGSYTNVVGLPVAETFEAIVAMSIHWGLIK